MPYACQTGASAAIVALDGSLLGDRQISVALSNPPSRKPRQPGADQMQRAKEQPGRYKHVTLICFLLLYLSALGTQWQCLAEIRGVGFMKTYSLDLSYSFCTSLSQKTTQEPGWLSLGMIQTNYVQRI